MDITLKHLNVIDIAKHSTFDNVNSLAQLDKAIKDYGLKVGEKGDDEHNDRIGHAYEVYAEFWLKRYGQPSNPLLGITEVTHTSDNKYERGLDFWFKQLNGSRGVLQVKFRSNPMFKFKRGDLGSLVDVCDEHNIEKLNGRIVFTNLEHLVNNDDNGIFAVDAAVNLKRFRVIDRSIQSAFIDRDPTFWCDLHISIVRSTPQHTFDPLPPLWEHQKMTWDKMLDILNSWIVALV